MPHDIIAQNDSTNGTLTFMYDGHGSTRALLDAAAAIVQTFAYDAYGNHLTAVGLTSSADAYTNLLYSGEWTLPTGLQYLRARYYNPSTGRFNRLDPFAGNTQDPQSLHKYTYAMCAPTVYADPTGWVATLTEVTVSLTLQDILLSAWATWTVYNWIEAAGDAKARFQQLQVIATNLQTELLPVVNAYSSGKTKNSADGMRTFFHGSSSKLWLNVTSISAFASRDKADFGLGFYTFPDTDIRSWPAVERWARHSADRNGGWPFVLVAGMRYSGWAAMNKWALVKPHEWSRVVNEFRRQGRPPISGYDVIYGPTAKKGGGRWVQNPSLPHQYKFEAGGVARLVIIGIAPIGPEYIEA